MVTSKECDSTPGWWGLNTSTQHQMVRCLFNSRCPRTGPFGESTDEEDEFINELLETVTDFRGTWEHISEYSYQCTVTHDVVGLVSPFVFDMVHVDSDNKFTDKDYEKDAIKPVNGDGKWNSLMYLVSPKHQVGSLAVVFMRTLKGKQSS